MKPQIKPLILVLVMASSDVLLYAYENFSAGSRMSGLSNCGVSIPDVWSLSHNLAGIAFLSKNEIAIDHQQRFLLKELSQSNIAFVFPYSNSFFGLSYSYFGYSQYNQSKSGLAYALRINSKLAFGLQLDYFRSSIKSSGITYHKITFEAGLLTKPIENLTIGMHIFNPMPKKWNGHTDSELQSITRFGSSYFFENTILFTLELQTDFKYETIKKVGLEYSPAKTLVLRAGISSDEYEYAFGISYVLKNLNLGLAYLRHETLGTSPSLSIAYVW